jgi:hypothetical protein
VAKMTRVPAVIKTVISTVEVEPSKVVLEMSEKEALDLVRALSVITTSSVVNVYGVFQALYNRVASGAGKKPKVSLPDFMGNITLTDD